MRLGQAKFRLVKWSKLRMHAHCRARHRSAVTIVSRVVDPLIIEGEMRRFEYRQRIIAFKDLLRPGMRQPAVADENAEPAGIQIALAGGGDAVVDRGHSQRVVGAMPCRSLP